MTTNSNKKKIFINTIMLYFRQILIMIVNLYSIRIVLNVLGAEDYGVYNVVAGIVTMFSFLSSAMAASTQRFYSFSLGQNDFEGLKKVFNISLEIYLVLILIVVLLAETLGLWFVQNKLVIPVQRMSAAVTVYHFAIVTFIFGLIAAPFMALIISHEDMSVYAYVSIVEAILKLSIIFLLKCINFDKLILYGALLSFVTVIITFTYFVYCRVRYKETKFRFTRDKKLFSEIASFSGWCLFGTSAGIIKNQITNIFLNMYFGPLVNAARGIALQVNSAVMSFASNFNMAVRPQIVKTYSVNDKEETFNLVYQGTKLSFILLYIFMLPLYLEMNYVLTLWLKNVPDMTVIFTRLILIELLFDTISMPLQSLSQASGKMKLYQSVVGGTLLLNLPCTFILLKLGFSAYAVQICAIIIGFIALYLRIVINAYLTGMKIKYYFIKCIVPCLVVGVLSSICPILFCRFMKESFLRVLIVIFFTLISVFIASFLFGFNKDEKAKVKEFIKNKFNRRQ